MNRRLAVCCVLLAIVLGGCGGDDDDDVDVLPDSAVGGPDAPGSGSPDAPGSGAPDAPGAAADAGRPDGAVGVDCGGMMCVMTDECCLMGMSVSCVPAGTCPGGPVACDGPEDCGGDNCCVMLGGGGMASSMCSADPCPQITACHDNSHCTGGLCCPPPFGSWGYCAIGGSCPF
jgi:hypothetical protein